MPAAAAAAPADPAGTTATTRDLQGIPYTLPAPPTPARAEPDVPADVLKAFEGLQALIEQNPLFRQRDRFWIAVRSEPAMKLARTLTTHQFGQLALHVAKRAVQPNPRSREWPLEVHEMALAAYCSEAGRPAMHAVLASTATCCCFEAPTKNFADTQLLAKQLIWAMIDQVILVTKNAHALKVTASPGARAEPASNMAILAELEAALPAMVLALGARTVISAPGAVYKILSELVDRAPDAQALGQALDTLLTALGYAAPRWPDDDAFLDALVDLDRCHWNNPRLGPLPLHGLLVSTRAPSGAQSLALLGHMAKQLRRKHGEGRYDIGADIAEAIRKIARRFPGSAAPARQDFLNGLGIALLESPFAYREVALRQVAGCLVDTGGELTARMPVLAAIARRGDHAHEDLMLFGKGTFVCSTTRGNSWRDALLADAGSLAPRERTALCAGRLAGAAWAQRQDTAAAFRAATDGLPNNRLLPELRAQHERLGDSHIEAAIGDWVRHCTTTPPPPRRDFYDEDETPGAAMVACLKLQETAEMLEQSGRGQPFDPKTIESAVQPWAGAAFAAWARCITTPAAGPELADLFSRAPRVARSKPGQAIMRAILDALPQTPRTAAERQALSAALKELAAQPKWQALHAEFNTCMKALGDPAPATPEAGKSVSAELAA